MLLIVVNAQRPVAFLLVRAQALDRGLLQHLVDLVGGIRGGPVDELVDTLHGAFRHLHVAIARLTFFNDSMSALSKVKPFRSSIRGGELKAAMATLPGCFLRRSKSDAKPM